MNVTNNSVQMNDFLRSFRNCVHTDNFSGCHVGPHRHISKCALVILLLIPALVSLVGNSLVVVVISRKRRMQTVTNYFVFNLTIADLLTSLFCLSVDVTTEIEGHWIFGPALCNILFPLRALTIFASIFTLTVLSLIRCWAVVYPFKTQPTISFAKICLASIWTVSSLLIIPYMSILRYDEKAKICYEDWTRAQSQLYTVLTSTFTYFIPVCIIASSYTRIVFSTTTTRSKRFSTSFIATSKLAVSEQRSVLGLAVVISASFAMCSLPYHVVWVMYEFTDIPQRWVYFADLATLTYVVFYLNSALNPINYNVYSKSFRKGFMELYRKVSCLSELQTSRR